MENDSSVSVIKQDIANNYSEFTKRNETILTKVGNISLLGLVEGGCLALVATSDSLRTVILSATTGVLCVAGTIVNKRRLIGEVNKQIDNAVSANVDIYRVMLHESGFEEDMLKKPLEYPEELY